jgi:UDP-GlcNAc:undecaprenyl-phosphate/decaprenyl-phosphate GlcNAc-1-phosphate transferase
MVTLFVWCMAFLVAYFSIPVIRKIAFRFDVLDIPGGRKIHKQVTPLLGGIGVFLGLMAGMLIYALIVKFMGGAARSALNIGSIMPILVGATLILVLGLIEDIWGLSAQARFTCQVLVALGMIISGLKIDFLPGTAWGNMIEVVLTCVWIVGLTNAYNYLDGLDGLASGSAAINLFFFAVILYAMGQYALGLIAVILTASCMGFLPYNLHKTNKIFLGEAGSTFLGFTLACIGIQGSWAHNGMVRVFVPILILGVPIFDMIFTTIMRVRDGKVKTIIEWLQYGGKDHFHHYLVDVGLSTWGAVLFIYAITTSLGISAYMVSNDNAIEGLLTISQATIIFWVIAVLIVVGRRRRSGWR